MQKSTHKAEVIPIILEKHPSADKLSIVRHDGYTIVVATDQWSGQKNAAHILPESIVDTTREEFAWLHQEGKSNLYRVKACKLRGVLSYGFLCKVPDSFNVGDDAAEFLGVTHYDPEAEFDYTTRGDNIPSPRIHSECLKKYDVDSLLRYHRLFTEGEQVWITQKINGSNARYINHNKQIYCGSRSYWKKESNKDLWWQALANTPNLRTYLEKHPEVLLWGEVYGQVKGFRYGLEQAQFICFDIFKEGKFLNSEEALVECLHNGIEYVPVVEVAPFSLDRVKELATKPCKLDAYTMNEGVVVRPQVERRDDRLGRVILKCINPAYLE